MAYKYFLFSQQYAQDRNAVEEKVGKQFVSGTVVANGQLKEFNILSDTKEVARYADARLITEGDTDVMKFEKPKSKQRRS